MLVFKLGGSHYSNPLALSNWIKKLAHVAKHTPVIIVPGGGIFADQVRDAQTLHPISDEAAHHMALFAMAQFGLLLSSYSTGYQFIHHPSECKHTSSGLMIWLPNSDLTREVTVEQSWNITSDSLALWFSQSVLATKLILIKSIKVTNFSIETLSNKGVIDAGFNNLYNLQPIASYIVHSDDHLQIETLISSQTKRLI